MVASITGVQSPLNFLRTDTFENLNLNLNVAAFAGCSSLKFGAVTTGSEYNYYSLLG
jgi:hypothetical protein